MTKEKVITIDNELAAETYEDKVSKDIDELQNSIDKNEIIRGRVSGVETVNDMPVAVVRHGTIKVIIPSVEFMDITVKEKNDPMQLYRILMNKRLGSEIDFIVKAIDPDKKIAIASRKEAMKQTMDKAYQMKDDDGEYTIKNDVPIEVRVVAVMRSGIIVDAFGKEIYIPPKDLSYNRVYNSAELFTPGDRILTLVKSITRKDDDVELVLSVKEAYDNPIGDIIKRYNEGDIYTGVVTMIDKNNVFVRLDGGIDVLCKYPKYGLNPIIDAEVAVRITLKNTEMNRLFGVIVNVARI